MCQAYEAERNFIVHGEHFNTIKGFAAARNGEPKKSNPNGQYSKYDRESWDHGWDCWHARILPYALELKLENKDGWTRFRASQEFKETGTLPKPLEQILEAH